eukprot:10650987-Heterocapsa_arctica.AAC.1
MDILSRSFPSQDQGYYNCASACLCCRERSGRSITVSGVTWHNQTAPQRGDPLGARHRTYVPVRRQ